MLKVWSHVALVVISHISHFKLQWHDCSPGARRWTILTPRARKEHVMFLKPIRPSHGNATRHCFRIQARTMNISMNWLKRKRGESSFYRMLHIGYKYCCDRNCPTIVSYIAGMPIALRRLVFKGSAEEWERTHSPKKSLSTSPQPPPSPPSPPALGGGPWSSPPQPPRPQGS